MRHPDHAPAAFEDLWRTIKAGKPWQGLVKNRCKNGDFYWVDANVTPIVESGQTVEAVSIRSNKPTASQIADARASLAKYAVAFLKSHTPVLIWLVLFLD